MPTKLIYRHWQAGSRVASFAAGTSYERRFGAPYYGIHRADLQRLLVEARGVEHVHLNRQLVHISTEGEGYRLVFADGSVTHADVVVGADGVHSTVRRWVTAEHAVVYSGTSGFRGLIPAAELANLPTPGTIQYWMGPGAHVLHYPIGDGTVINFLAVVDEPAYWSDSSWVREIDPDELAAAFGDWHPGVRELVTATTLHRRWALFGQKPLNRWHRDGVVLLGDAVHAMLPHHGQGANQTIEDAVTLAECLATTEQVTPALRRYASLRRGRTRHVQRGSWAASALLHVADGPAAVRRDDGLAEIPTVLDGIHGHDALAAASG